MKVVFLIAFLLVMAHCTPVREFNPGIRHDYFLNWQRKPPMNRGTTTDSMLPFSPVTETAPPLTSTPSGLFTPSGPSTPDRRGDM
ncbi:unnamed protein product [Rangifer tarandus platyrhynchus]|uniref:Uncharacterized protein n=1 Tax=Rangifer tarandus platyrhynchus TaxID=3082113 RepID=A0ABN8ZE06_RANTA|nr:unnamed protein product [Rangifer tarandus platyrhynchus]